MREGRVALGDGGLQPRQRRGVPSPARRCWPRRCAAAWGFDGYVVGDCGAVDGRLRSTTSSSRPRPRPPRPSLRAGTDLDCGRAYRAPRRGARARPDHREADLDRALVRLFTARFRLGLFDPPDRVPWSGLGRGDRSRRPATWRWRARPRARSIVLLENRTARCRSRRRCAGWRSIGPTADDLPVLLANYHGTPSRPVTLLDGIRAAARARGITVGYAAGARLVETSTGRHRGGGRGRRATPTWWSPSSGLDPRLEGEEGGDAA